MAGQTLKGTLYQSGPDGQVQSFPGGTPREKLPKWVKVDDGAFDGEPEAKPARKASEPDGSLPPKSGNGSGQANWLAYARTEENAAKLAAAEIEIKDDAKQSEIIAALEKAEIPTEKPAGQ
ncbi:hypothetical protein [Blastococcus sp. CCUG 61487]|uniref:hypothetical protein n=1 Tax=Blastococcus sp. CCUG 61487 TaxID=1840703 RepID=UPI0010C0B341|nr:hypothetical protein [Blastococcus sp. CCUG 61487]TKJ25226.1 hypothetical protein A6V29_04175 [Blastococcus sp. CCUG 61487]